MKKLLFVFLFLPFMVSAQTVTPNWSVFGAGSHTLQFGFTGQTGGKKSLLDSVSVYLRFLKIADSSKYTTRYYYAHNLPASSKSYTDSLGRALKLYAQKYFGNTNHFGLDSFKNRTVFIDTVSGQKIVIDPTSGSIIGYTTSGAVIVQNPANSGQNASLGYSSVNVTSGSNSSRLSYNFLAFFNSASQYYVQPPSSYPTTVNMYLPTSPNALDTIATLKDIRSGGGLYQPLENQRLSSGNSPSFTKLSLIGTAGGGYYDMISQSVSPTSLTSHLRLYSDSLNRLSWKNSTYRRTLRVTRQRDMTISFPYVADPILADSTQTAAAIASAVSGAGYVPTSRTVAGFPLSSNVTLANHSPSLGILGSAYNGSTSQSWSVDTANIVHKNYLNTVIPTIINSRFPQNTRAINTGIGLSGGGNLSADRTIIADTTTLVSQARENSVIGTATLARINTKFTLPSLTAGSVLYSDGTTIAQDNANFFWDATNHRLGLATTAPTHTQTFSSTATGLAMYNTVAQTSNYERGTLSWQANVLELGTFFSGTGTMRALRLGVGATSGNTAVTKYVQINNTGSLPVYDFVYGSSATAGTFANLANGTFTATSGFQNAVGINPTMNTTSAAGSRALWISPLVSGNGSAGGFLIDAGTNTSANGAGTHTSKFTVDINGSVVGLGGLSTTGTAATANMQVAGGSSVGTTGTFTYRTIFNGSTTGATQASGVYGNLLVGSSPLTGPPSGTTTIAAQLAVNGFGTFTAGGGNIAVAAVGYFGSAPTFGTANYSIYSMGNVNIQSLTASKLVYTDANKTLISGTGTSTQEVRGDGSLVNAFQPLRLTGSGTGSATTISIAHGLSGVSSTSNVFVTAKNAASAGFSYVTTDATNLNIVYSVAPTSGTNNLSFDVAIKP